MGWDHVPPLHLVERMTEEDRMLANLRKYPACHECNVALGGKILRTLVDRRAFIKRYLRHKYRKWLEMPEWDDIDLSELSGADARRYIEQHMRFARLVRQRLAW